jgi:hypothetical protein
MPTPLPSEIGSTTPPATPAVSGLTSPWAYVGNGLLWTAVGVVLGLGIIFITHTWYQHHSR